LYSNIEAHVQMVQDQLRDPTLKLFPRSLEVYAPKALSEYKMYLSKYFEWERSGIRDIPKLLPSYQFKSEDI